MNAQTTYLHHLPPSLEGTTSSRGRRAEQLQFSHNPYYSSVRTTAAEGADMFHFVTSARDVEVYYVVQASYYIKLYKFMPSYPNTSLDCVTRIENWFSHSSRANDWFPIIGLRSSDQILDSTHVQTDVFTQYFISRARYVNSALYVVLVDALQFSIQLVSFLKRCPEDVG